jgi:hypothetical protein
MAITSARPSAIALQARFTRICTICPLIAPSAVRAPDAPTLSASNAPGSP